MATVEREVRAFLLRGQAGRAAASPLTIARRHIFCASSELDTEDDFG
jgi:hypothetical protein